MNDSKCEVQEQYFRFHYLQEEKISHKEDWWKYYEKKYFHHIVKWGTALVKAAIIFAWPSVRSEGHNYYQDWLYQLQERKVE